jgi:hypothetical protein
MRGLALSVPRSLASPLQFVSYFLETVTLGQWLASTEGSR